MPAQAPVSSAERQQLLDYLAQQRLYVRAAAHGMTDEQARSAPTASELSVGGLIKHLAYTEGVWTAMVDRRRPAGDQSAYMAAFRLDASETLDEVLARYAEVATETDRLFAGIEDLNQPVPVPKGVPWYPADLEAWTVRWVLLHLITETARHAGHAEIVREAVDGATALPLLAAVEGWSPTPWLEPWEPSNA